MKSLNPFNFANGEKIVKKLGLQSLPQNPTWKWTRKMGRTVDPRVILSI